MVKEEKFALAGGQVKISHITLYIIDPDTKKVFTKEEQEKVLKRIKNTHSKINPASNNFGAIAKQYSEDEITKFRGGNLGWTSRWPLFAKGLVKHAFSLAKEKISNPIKTGFGYHIIMITDINQGENLSYEQLKEKAKERLVQNKKEMLLVKWFKEAKIKRFLK